MPLESSYIYILASARNGTIYVGVTTDLMKHVSEHRQKIIAGFTKKYNATQLVYYEVFENIEAAILREKTLKKWKRHWKLALIEKNNPAWNDLFVKICG